METGGLMDVQGAQIAAIVIFIGMFGLIISEKVERHIVTLSAALLTLLVVPVLYSVFVNRRIRKAQQKQAAARQVSLNA